MTRVDQVKVERIARRRAMCARLMALVLLLTTMHDIGTLHGATGLGGISFATGAVWMAMILIFVLVAGGGFVRSPALRAAVYDESTIRHGLLALALGFWSVLATCGVYWIVSLHHAIGGAEVARAVVTVGVAITLLRFATLEMEAMKE